MKKGRSLTDMATELDRQCKAKKDYIAPIGHLSMTNEGALEGINGGMKMTGHAERQLATFLDIPWRYYEKMKAEMPSLLAHNANSWFQHKPNETRMVRTLDSRVRAMLSKRYRPLDNYDLAEVALPILQEQGCEVVSCELTESRMYIKAVTPKIEAEIAKGDIVQSGLVISNSEVGSGSVRIEPLIYRLICLNGMISTDNSLRKYHVGKTGSIKEGIQELLTDEAKNADDKAFWLKTRDVIKSAFNQAIFSEIVDKMRSSRENVIASTDLPKVVEVTTRHLKIADNHRNGILTHLVQGGELNRYGLLNAITRQSQDVKDYDEATELERVGGKILELNKKDWEVISTAV